LFTFHHQSESKSHKKQRLRIPSHETSISLAKCIGRYLGMHTYTNSVEPTIDRRVSLLL